MKDAEHSYQLKLTTPGGPYLRSSPAYRSSAATFSLLSSAALPSFVDKSAPIGEQDARDCVAFAFLSPRKTMPYMPGGAWKLRPGLLQLGGLFGGFRPFWAYRSFR